MRKQTMQQHWPQHLISQFEALEKLIRSHLDDHQQMLELIRRKREAIRHVDLQTIADVTACEQSLIQRISEVERHRTDLVKRLTLGVNPNAKGAMTVTALAEALGEEPVAARLQVLAAQLRDLALEVKKESSIVRQATDALSRHLSGVMQQVQSALSRARVYGRSGSLKLGRQMDFSVDVKT